MSISSWFLSLWTASSRAPTGQLRRSRLTVEALEDRFCPSADYLLVPSFDTDNVLRYDGATGAFVDEFVHHKDGGLNQPAGVVFGPHDDNLYVGSGYYGGPGQLRGVLRYNGATGQFLDVFTEPGHLEKVNQVLFGPDGNSDGYQDLYVCNGHEGSEGGVVRFDGITGAFIDDFVPPVAGRLRGPSGMVFGPSPGRPGQLDLYVTSAFYGNVLRFDGGTGAYLGEFVVTGSGGLHTAVGVAFGPDGNLYVSSSGFTWPAGLDDRAAILRYQGPHGDAPGAFIDTFVPAGSGGLLDTSALLFGPDGNGDGIQDLYVSSLQLTASYQTKEHTGSVKRYNGVTGAFIDTFVGIDSGGLDGPWAMTFTKTDPMTLAYRAGDEPRISISDVSKKEGEKEQTILFTFTVTLSVPYDQAVTMSYRTVNGNATTSGGDYIAETGTLTFAAGETTKTITIEVKGDSKREANETFYLDLFGNSSNSLFTKNRGLGTILNDD